MKKLVILFFAIVLGTSSAFANEKKGKLTKKEKTRIEFCTQITKYLGNYNRELNEDLTANVRLMLNHNNEIVVLSVDSKNEGLVSYVKTKLNYKKVSVENLEKMKVFILPLKIKRV